MAKIMFATKADGTTKFYPITITPAVIDTARDQRLSVTIADIYASKSSKTSIVTCTTSTIPATLATDTYYNITDAVSSVTLNLPTITDNSHLSVVSACFTTSTGTPSVTITSANSANIAHFSGYSIDASTTYELNMMWNGTKWIVAYATIE